jgi:hypothetical protein
VKLGFGLPTKQVRVKPYFLMISRVWSASAFLAPKSNSQWLPSITFHDPLAWPTVDVAGLKATQSSLKPTSPIRSVSQAFVTHEPMSGCSSALSWFLAYNGRKIRAFFAGGNGGQVSMAIPDLDVAIAFTGGNYADAATFVAQRMFVPDYLLPAVTAP